MTSTFSLLADLLDALACGAVTLRLGKIEGHAGYLHVEDRVVTLNPDAAPADLGLELVDQLGALALAPREEPAPEPAARVALVHSTAQADEPSPPRCRGPRGTQRVTSGFRVVG